MHDAVARTVPPSNAGRGAILYAVPFFLALFASILSFRHSEIGEEALNVQVEGEISRAVIFGTIYALAFLLCLAQHRSFIREIRNHKTYLFFVAYVLLTSFWSDFPGKVLVTWGHYLGFYLICSVAMLSLERNEKLFFKLLMIFSAVSILSSLIAVCFFPSRGIMDFEGKDRWVGLTYSPNNLGELALVSIWTCAVYLCYERKSLPRVCAIVISALSLLCLVGANSMTSLLLAFGIVIAVPTFAYIRVNNLLIAASFCSAALVCLWLVLVPELSETAFLFQLLGRDASFTGRTDIWDTALRAIADKPLFGWGFDVLMSLRLSYKMRYDQLHNGYLDLLVSGGVIGLSFLGLLLRSIVRSLNTFKCTNPRFFGALSSLLFVIIVHNLTEASLGRSPHLLWLMVSIIYFYAQSHRETFKLKSCSEQRFLC